MASLRIALAQINTTVGDLAGNRQRIIEWMLRAKAWRADLVVFPELTLTGYPPEDLLLKPAFVEETRRALRDVAPFAADLIAFVGYVDRDQQGRLYNSAAVLAHGRHAATYRKQCLPNYGVFDERRYFTPGDRSLALGINETLIGVTICEDLWMEQPISDAAAAGCRLAVNLSASPYDAGKLQRRMRLFMDRAATNRISVAYCNLVGGQDELVFDGASLLLDAQGGVVGHGAQFREDFAVFDVELPAAQPRPRSGLDVVRLEHQPQTRPVVSPTRSPWLEPLDEVYEALVLGTRDYVLKNGFEAVVLGLSGGIDSSLVACIAVDALGPGRVVGVTMPSRFSSTGTQHDAKVLAERLGIRFERIEIEDCFEAYLSTLAPLFAGREHDVTEQNLQARIRGNLLMALSNKFGWMVLATGNKSEMAVGYCTLYGDMAGGFAVIKDVPKTLVYQLSRLCNERCRRQGRAEPILESVFTRAPTAELRHNQTDQDTLPPYDVLDRVLKAYVEEDHSLPEIAQALGLEPELVRRLIRMIDRAEYKRRQAPPGVKITPKAFGKDRRMPITNRYQHG